MIRSVLAVIAGLVIGMVVNMGLIHVGHIVIAPPPGSDLSTLEGVKAAMPFFGPEQFIFPFLAHAGGSLVGATVAAFISANHKFTVAMIIGVITLIGGITAGIMFPAPVWYDVIDLLSYIPAAWIGAKIGGAGRA
jgi:hypothetical protein